MKAFYFLKQNGRSPLIEHFETVNNKKEFTRLQSAMERLMENEGRLPYSFSEHIEGKILALRSYQGNQRVYYCLDQGVIIFA